MHNSNPIIRKHQPNPSGGMFYKISGLYSTKNVNVTKTKIRWGTAPDWRQRDVTLNAMCDP